MYDDNVWCMVMIVMMVMVCYDDGVYDACW